MYYFWICNCNKVELIVIDPLLVMHDGQNVFNASTSFLGHSWRASQTIDKLIVEGNMEEIVVVAIYNTADRTDDYTVFLLFLIFLFVSEIKCQQ